MRRALAPPTLHAALVLAGLAVGAAIRAINLGEVAYGYDELYHVLAAKALLAGDGLVLPSGRPYTRGALVSVLTAGAFALFGEHEWAARLPALLFGVASLVLIYAAGRRLFGPTAGLVALWLLALSPEALDASRYARVYSPLTFFGLAAAVSAFRALDEGSWRWAVLALSALGVAVHLHPVALGFLLVVGAYAGLEALGARLGARPKAPRHTAVAAGLLALGLLAAATPRVRALVALVALTPLPWYRPAPGDALFYHQHLTGLYGWLWPLVWPATVVAVFARSGPGLFTALAFWLPLVLISGVVATKHVRYVIHLLPFAWLLLGGAAAALWAPTREAVLTRLRPWVRDRIPDAALLAAVLVLTLAPLVRLLPSARVALARPFERHGAFTTGHFDDWRGLARALGPRLGPGALVVTRIQLAARHYLGRPAYHLIGAETRLGGADRERSRRRDEGQVQDAGDLERLRSLGQPVWLVVEQWRWEAPRGIDDGLKRAAGRDCRRVPVGPEVAFIVFACDPTVRGPSRSGGGGP